MKCYECPMACKMENRLLRIAGNIIMLVYSGFFPPGVNKDSKNEMLNRTSTNEINLLTVNNNLGKSNISFHPCLMLLVLSYSTVPDMINLQFVEIKA